MLAQSVWRDFTQCVVLADPSQGRPLLRVGGG
jgi:hypothetical protein